MPKAPNTKTRKVAVWPNGRRYPLRRENGLWYWDQGCGSNSLAAVKRHLAEQGGRLETEPNPAYREPTGLDLFQKLTK